MAHALQSEFMHERGMQRNGREEWEEMRSPAVPCDDLFDAKTKNLVWRASATDTLFDKSDKNMKKLNNSVSRLFEHFPPQPKK